MLQPAEEPTLPDSHCAFRFTKNILYWGQVCVNKLILSGIY